MHADRGSGQQSLDKKSNISIILVCQQIYLLWTTRVTKRAIFKIFPMEFLFFSYGVHDISFFIIIYSTNFYICLYLFHKYICIAKQDVKVVQSYIHTKMRHILFNKAHTTRKLIFLRYLFSGTINKRREKKNSRTFEQNARSLRHFVLTAGNIWYSIINTVNLRYFLTSLNNVK